MDINFKKLAVLLPALMPFSAVGGVLEDLSIYDEPLADRGAVYESGRGLLTLEGPSGMFINPTSATLPRGASTLQYCMFLPARSGDVIGNGIFGSYGVTEWLEAGFIGKYIEPKAGDGVGGAGPFARVRLLKNDGLVPQVGLGAYGQWGDAAVSTYGIFSAAYWRMPIDEDGFFKSLGVHLGARETWYDVGVGDSFHGYGGLELQLPLRVYLVGEVSTRDNDKDPVENPYAFGAQWRLYGINLSVAGIQNGGLKKGPALFWGIGGVIQF